jgi:hypothetical protein
VCHELVVPISIVFVFLRTLPLVRIENLETLATFKANFSQQTTMLRRVRFRDAIRL